MKKLLFLFSFILLFAGCATNTFNVKNDFSLDKAQKESLVFGKLCLEDFYFWANGYNIYVQNLNDNTRYRIMTDITLSSIFLPEEKAKDKVQNYYFFVKLPAGKYKVYAIFVQGPMRYARNDFSSEDVTFLVNPSSIVYIGTLKFSILDEIKLSGEMKVNILSLDERKEAIDELRGHYPNIKDEVKVNIIQIR